MTSPASLLTLTILVILGLLWLSATYRWRSSRQATVLRLVIYSGIVTLAYLAQLMDILSIEPVPGFSYQQFYNLALLSSVVMFGALTLGFLQTVHKQQIRYWLAGLAVVLLWITASRQWLPLPTNLPLPAMLAAAGWLGAIASAYIALAAAFGKQPSSKHRNRLRYWLIATTLHAASGLILFISPAVFFWAGSPLFVAGSVLAGYVVLSYHTPDLNRLIGRALRRLTATALLAAVFYLALATTIVVSRSGLQPINVFFWSTVLAIFLAIITQPTWLQIYRWLTLIILGRQERDDKELIRHFSRSLSSALDMQRLGDILINLMNEAFELNHGAVFINERGGGTRLSLRPLAHIGPNNLTYFEFGHQSLFVDYFRRGNKYLFQYDIDVLPQFAGLDPAERAWLSDLKMELFVPIVRQLEVMGILAFGARTKKSGFYEEDVELAVTMADQVVLAMDGARLFEQLATIGQEMGVMNEKFNALDQNKSDFLSIASHELRTPLTHIHGYSRMLLDLTEEEARDFAYVKTIVAGVAKGSERMKNIIDMMFDVTEANDGDMSLLLGPVNLGDLIRQASGPFLPALDERRIAFDTKGFEELPIIEADGSRLMLALENLLSNAIKYTPDGGLITIDAKPVIIDNVGSAVEITVIDSGIGIAPEHHERIFEKFFRVDDTNHHSTGRTKFKGAGPGLGLTLVKGIAEAHGGKVWVESPGHDEKRCPGSKFHFLIPLHPVSTGKKETRRQSQIETVQWSRKLKLPDAN